MAPDGAGGAYVFGTPGATVQHMAADGQVAAGWGPDGLRLGTGDAEDIASDGAGGAIAVFRPLTAQKLAPDGVVAVTASLVSSEAGAERVRLVWQLGNGTVPAVTLERRQADTAWDAIASAVPDGVQRVAFEDAAVIPGARYGYRLRWREADGERFSGEVWIDVPRTVDLALEGLRPNPFTSAGALRVAFALPDEAPATLEMLDVSGRRVLARDLAGLGPGRHVLQLEGLAQPAPGLYFLRLSHPERTIVTRGIVVR